MDKQCLGDLIQVANRPGRGIVASNIWVNHSSFEKCGDGCIDMVRPDDQDAMISISYNLFNGTDKTMIAGTPYNAASRTAPARNIPVAKHYYHISIYGNWFKDVHERNPRASSTIIHMYDNFMTDWTTYVVGVDNANVYFENNRLKGSNPKVLQALVKPADQKGHMYAHNNDATNLGKGVEQPANYEQLRKDAVTAPYQIRDIRDLDFSRSGWVYSK